MELHHGDCLEVLRTLADNSIDSIVTDPPYGLTANKKGGTGVASVNLDSPYGRARIGTGNGAGGFMGLKWDVDVPSVEVWAECLRVLKPGGHLLAFAGTRTQHRMAVRIEDAGFEIRDMIAWVYSQGFPKSVDVSKQIDQQEKNRWVKISKAIDNANLSEIAELWINSKNANAAGLSFQRKQTEAGLNTQKSGFAHGSVLLQASHKSCDALAVIAELNLIEAHPTSAVICSSAQPNAESAITALRSHANNAGGSQENHEATRCMVDFSALQSAWVWQDESKADKLKAVEALKIWLGSKPSSRQEATSALCAALTDDLKLITLSQSKTFLSFDTTRQMVCASVISATITESTAESLISFTADTLKSKAIDKAAGAEREVIGVKVNTYDGANRNPSKHGNPADQSNIGKWGLTQTPHGMPLTAPATDAARQWQGWGTALKPALEPITVARKPLVGTVAENVLAHGTGALNIDGCRVAGEPVPVFDTVGGRKFEQTHTQPERRTQQVGTSDAGRWPANLIHDGSDEPAALLGDAARFFYCAKASRSDRGADNKHPTVKPTDLMRYLCRLVTPPGGVVLDPFMGSGSTGVAAIQLGRKFIGIEREERYFDIACKRIEEAQRMTDMFGFNGTTASDLPKQEAMF